MKSIPVFTLYQLTSEEELQGRILSETQLAVLNNDLVDALNNRLALRLDTTNPMSFAQQEAEFSGRIVYIQALIQQHNEALETLSLQVQQAKEM